MKKFLLLAGLLAAGLAGLAQAEAQTQTPADAPSLPEQIVRTLDRLSGGPHAGQRANHAKGLIAAGIFTPTVEAAGISRAPHFRRSVGATIRFSTGTGLPTMADAGAGSRPYGLAIRFALPGRSYTDFVGLSHNGFPVATPEDFAGLLDAVAASRGAAASPTPLDQFLDTHPAARTFLQAPKPVPKSFATQSFYGVNAFEFINQQGASVFGRYRFVPVAGEQSLSDEEAAAVGPNYLMEELAERVAVKPVKFRVLLQIAEAGDVVDDPTVIWPEDRRLVELGLLIVTRVVPDAKEVERKLAYDPLMLPDGIRPSKDPVLLFRPAAYAVSAARRQ